MLPLFTTRVRAEWADWLCNPAKMDRVAFPGDGGRVWRLLVADASVPAWEAFTAVMGRHGYLFREPAGGTYNCRRTNHNPDLEMSLHSNGVCVDLNPSKNPQGTTTTDMPAPFRSDLLALRCGNGRPVFRWGGDWKGSIADPMHWQLACTPADIRSGIRDPNEEDDMTPTQARIEVAAAWYARAGVWMDGAGAEDPQARLTRLAGQYQNGERTVDDIVQFVGRVRDPQPGEAVPAWVLDPTAAYSAPIYGGTSGGSIDKVARKAIADLRIHLRKS